MFFYRSVLPYMQNRPLAISTAWGEQLMVVFVTVRLSLSLKEASRAQLLLTHHTHKVLRVPDLAQCCDHLKEQNNGEKRHKKLRLVCNLCLSGLHPTFPTMPLLHAAQWPFAVVRTPIFSRSELSPPSRSSMVSVFCLWDEAVSPEPAGMLLLSCLFSCCPTSGFLFTDCLSDSVGGVVPGSWS